MTGTASPAPAPVAVFHGPVACRRAANTLTLSGSAADSADDRLILTFTSPSSPRLPECLTDASVRAVDQQHYIVTCESRELIVEATALHIHRDVGKAFHRAVPPRPAPLGKRLFWQVVLRLAGTRAGKRLLLSLRRQA